MKIVINAINAVSPGAFQIAYNFLKALSTVDLMNQYLILLPSGYGYETLNVSQNLSVRYFQWCISKKIWYAIFYGMMFKSIIKNFSADAIIAFGNFNPVKTGVSTMVLLQNAFYVDFEAIHYLPFLQRMNKKIEIAAFSRTVNNADFFVVESSYIKERLSTVWGVSHDRIEVCPNSLSQALIVDSKHLVKRPDILKGKFILLYVSRFYPYKNHEFILKVANYLRFKNIEDVVFLITVDDNIDGAKNFLQRTKAQGLERMIINIGEIPQNELIKWYKISDALFYPSSLETFGNPLIEAMSFGLPIFVVDLPYAKAVCGDAALYFSNDSVEDTAEKILAIKKSEELRKELSSKSLQKFSQLPTWEQTVNRYLSIITSMVHNKNLRLPM